MNEDRSTSLHSPSDTSQRSIVCPVLTWALVQLVALAMSAGQVRLWARMPSTTDSYALWIMLAAQAGTSAMLFPWLLRDIAATAFSIGLSAPCLQLAGMLSNSSGWAIAECSAGIALWLLGLALANRALVSDAAKLLGIAVASMLSVGGACLVYLRLEFTSETAPNLRVDGWVAVGVVVLTGIAANLRSR